jgi:type I restriction enzyme S subunit
MMGEGNLPELPQAWEWTTIGEVTQPIEKVKPKENPDTQFTYLDISSIDNQLNKVVEPKVYYGSEAPSRARQLVRAHDVLFSTVRTYLKNIALVPEIYDGQIASTGFSVLRGESDISPKYLFYYSLTDQFINPLSKLQRGTSYPAVRDSDVRVQLIPLPPAAEQHRIVAKIEELFTQLDAGVAALEKARAQLRRYRQAVLKAAVEGELTREWREVHRGELEPASVLLERVRRERKEKGEKLRKSSPLDTSGLPELPERWTWATLPQLGELNRGKSKHRPRNAPWLYGGPYPFIQTGDVRHARGVIRKYSQTYSEEGLRQSRLWPAGTLCITIAANIAETAILGFDGCFPDSIVGFLADPSHCNVQYIEFFFRTAKEDIERYAPATAQKNINLRILSDLAVPLPPLDEQQAVVDEVERRLSVADEMEKAVEQSLKRAERLRQSILKRAFEGKLVPQDPSDEPASVLLERIKA